MGIIAKTAMDLGIHVTGIIPEFLYSKEISFNEINSLKIVKDMNQRKNIPLVDQLDIKYPLQ